LGTGVHTLHQALIQSQGAVSSGLHMIPSHAPRFSFLGYASQLHNSNSIWPPQNVVRLSVRWKSFISLAGGHAKMEEFGRTDRQPDRKITIWRNPF